MPTAIQFKAHYAYIQFKNKLVVWDQPECSDLVEISVFPGKGKTPLESHPFVTGNCVKRGMQLVTEWDGVRNSKLEEIACTSTNGRAAFNRIYDYVQETLRRERKLK